MIGLATAMARRVAVPPSGLDPRLWDKTNATVHIAATHYVMSESVDVGDLAHTIFGDTAQFPVDDSKAATFTVEANSPLNGRNIQLFVTRGAGDASVKVSLTTGALAQNNNTTALSVVRLGAGWWRIMATVAADGELDGGNAFRIITNNVADPTYQGDGRPALWLRNIQVSQ